MGAGRGSIREVFWTFLKLGLTSFGGPVAHLGYFQRELVEKQKWVTHAAYAELVARSQLLPGPTSSQVGFALGYFRAGLPGAVAATFAFTAPSALIMIAWGVVVGCALAGWIGLD